MAWAKRSGLDKIAGQLEVFREQGGQARLIVGIDEGGATRQGLELARELFTAVHVFHDPTGRTFHPKVYMADGPSHALLLVGSQNLTAGGVYYNYEAALQCRLDLTVDADQDVADAVSTYIERLYADEAVCLELTDAILAKLIDDPRYRVGDEDAGRRVRVDDAEESLDTDTDVEPEGERASIFGLSTEAKRAAPTRHPSRTRAQSSPTPATVAADETVEQPQDGVAIKRWFKRMAASDAQHPPTPGSNITGVLRLVQAGHPIDQTSYFRHDFFANLDWQATPNPRGVLNKAQATFDVTINGESIGQHVLRIDDASYREAGQGNHTSVLHWDDLGPVLAQSNYTNHYVIIERHADDSYRLEITPDEPGNGAFLA